MSKADDAARMVLIKEDPVALAILKVMEKVKPERRLYPDLYALEVAEAARGALSPTQQFRILRKVDGIFVLRGGIFSTFEEAQRQADVIVGFNPENECKVVARTLYKTEWEEV